MLNNEAVCACKEFYQGETCDTETRETYVGIYSGSPVTTIEGIDYTGSRTDYSVVKNGGDIAKFKISTTDTSNTTVFFCKLTSDSDFVIESVDAADDVTISGSGTISTTSFRISGTISQNQRGQTITGTFVINAQQ